MEGVLAAALTTLLGEAPRVVAAGRTDAGAHAEGQVANFWHRGRLAPERIRLALNALLPEDVCVLAADAVDASFHARYQALSRTYRYRWRDRGVRSALGRGQVFDVKARLDEGAMDEAARAAVGTHDWTSFTSVAGDRVREVTLARVERRADAVEFLISGRGFLRGLVRGLAGELTEIGRGRRPVDDMARLIAARARGLAPPPVPACGLTLVRVDYR